MTEIIERVTKEILAALKRDGDTDDGPNTAIVQPDKYGMTNINGSFDLRLVACAAIEAIREPTEAMQRAAKYDEYDWAANNWRAMIDVALAED